MMHRLAVLAITLAAVMAVGCLPDPVVPSDGGAGGSGGGGVTWTRDVKPIFAAKCAPCHTTQGLGFQNIATSYADVLKPVQSVDAPPGCFLDGFERMMPKKMGECALAAIMDGWMPMAMGCFNTPRPDPCVTVAQQDIVAAWVAAGMPE